MKINLLLFVIGFFIAINVQGEEKTKKVSFIPLWSPQAQFAGYYVAYEKGIYKKYGIDAVIIRGGDQNSPAQLLKTGKADFGILWLSAGIRERASGTPIVNIAQITQRSALILVAKKSSGITQPQDLNGKKISLWQGDLRIQPKAFIKKYRLNVTMVPQSYTINLFLRGGVDATSAMWYNEYHTILNTGLNENELTTFFYDQHGLNFPEDGIYTMERTFAKDPKLCTDFVKASLEGWQYSFDHEDEALAIVLKYMKDAGLPANSMHQKWMLDKMKSLIMPDRNQQLLGILKKEDYERVSSELKKNGDISQSPDFNRFSMPVINK
jgi:NitT/TauT family transport system substrate-binding protein